MPLSSYNFSVNISYRPLWIKYLLLSAFIHALIILLLALFLRKPLLEVKVKEVKINLVSTSQKDSYPIQTPKAPSSQKPKSQKPITKEEIDKAIFEIVAPKKSTYIPTSDSLSIVQTEKNVLSPREFSDQRTISEQKEFRIKGESQSEISKEVLKKSESGQGLSTSVPEVRSKDGGSVSGNIRWIKGEPRKVIEWYSPEIPPNIVKSKTEVVLTFFIEPSGFVSRIEIEKTSGEPLVDEIIYKTMKRIRFSTSTSQTIATVSLTIIPQ